jgi:hypothetical protein
MEIRLAKISNLVFTGGEVRPDVLAVAMRAWVLTEADFSKRPPDTRNRGPKFCAKSRDSGPRIQTPQPSPSDADGEKGDSQDMHLDLHYELLRDRMTREQELAEQRRLARLARRKPSLRARLARRLFALAVALDKRETWSAVWERLEAKGRL